MSSQGLTVSFDGSVPVTSVPFARRRTTTSAKHPSDLPASCRGARLGSVVHFDLAVHRGRGVLRIYTGTVSFCAGWIISIGLSATVKSLVEDDGVQRGESRGNVQRKTKAI
jgi:hypothetical protein